MWVAFSGIMDTAADRPEGGVDSICNDGGGDS